MAAGVILAIGMTIVTRWEGRRGKVEVGSRKDEVRSWKWEGGSKKEVGKVKDNERGNK